MGVLVGCLAGSIWLEVALDTRVLARWRRLLAALVCVVPLFVLWDLYAIARGHWSFDPRSVTGLRLPGHLPVEELLFFLIIPFAAILTFEAVRSARPDWLAGDEPNVVAAPDESVGDQ
jgi:lycopene cyclase domain-containing protein